MRRSPVERGSSPFEIVELVEIELGCHFRNGHVSDRPAAGEGRAVTVRPVVSGDGYLDSKSATPKNLKDLRSQAVPLLIIMIDSEAVR